MILDILERAEQYAAAQMGLAEAFGFLKRGDLATLASGRHELGGALYALVDRNRGRGVEAARLECHCRYLDVQFVVAGVERIGWAPLARCRRVTEAYDEQRDIGFFGDACDAWLNLLPGDFAVFFPEDAHAPLAGSGPVHKVVVKVPVRK